MCFVLVVNPVLCYSVASPEPHRGLYPIPQVNVGRHPYVTFGEQCAGDTIYAVNRLERVTTMAQRVNDRSTPCKCKKRSLLLREVMTPSPPSLAVRRLIQPPGLAKRLGYMDLRHITRLKRVPCNYASIRPEKGGHFPRYAPGVHG